MPLAGYSSVNSARVCFRPVLRKLRAFAEKGYDNGCSAAGDGGQTSETPRAPTTPKKPKTPGTPGSKPRGRPKKRKLDDPGDMDVSQGHKLADSAPISTAAVDPVCGSSPLAAKVKQEVDRNGGEASSPRKVKVEDASEDMHQRPTEAGRPRWQEESQQVRGAASADPWRPPRGDTEQWLIQGSEALCDASAGQHSFDFGAYGLHGAGDPGDQGV